MNDEKRKKVLIICPFSLPNLGGVESHISKLLSISVKRGFDVTLLTYQPLTRNVLGLPYEQGDHYEIYRLKWFGSGWFTKLEKYFPLVFLYMFPGLFVRSLAYYLKHHHEVHVIHAHGLVAGLIVRILTAIYPKKCIISTHAVYHFNARPILNFFVKNILVGFDKILAVSEVSKGELAEMGIPAEKLAVHPNWIDVDIFTPKDRDACRKDLNLMHTRNILFGVGRLIEMKGVLVFLEAAAMLPAIDFHIVGAGPLEETVRSYAQKYSNIIYHGILMQDSKQDLDKLIKLYNACDYLVSPYLYDEGFSTTLVEAVACGTPVVVTNRGSPPTFLSKDVAYFLSKSPNANEVKNVIENLYKTHGAISRENCRQFALEAFGFKNADVIITNYM